MKPTNKQQNSPLNRYANAYKSWKEAFPEGTENDFKNYLKESYNMWKGAYPNKSLNHFDSFVNNRIDTYKVNQKGWHVWTNEQTERYKKQKQQEKAEATLRFYGYSDEKLKNPNIKAHAIQLANNLIKREEAGKQYMKTVVGGTVGLMGAPYLVTASIPTLATIGGGVVGGKAVDKSVNTLSNKKYEGFGDAVSDKLTGNTESGWMFDFFNPGYLVGGAAGNRLVTGNFGRGLAFSAAMNKGIKNTTKYGDIRVSDSYFHNPDNAYRATTKAEVQDLRSVGHTRSSASNPKSEYNYTQGVGQGWLKGDSYMQHVENSSNPLTKFKHDNLLRSDGVILETSEGTFIPGYHGKVYGEPQKLSDIKVDIPTKKSYDKYFGWGYKHHDGGFSLEQFPFRGIVTDDSAPLQAENITYFTRGPKGQWIYNGKVIPEKRIIFEEPKTPSIGLDELSTMPGYKKVYSELNPWESSIQWNTNTKIYSSRLPKDIYSSNFVESIYNDKVISPENYKKAYDTFKKYILKDFGIRLEGEKYTVKDANTLRTEFDKLTDTQKQILADYFNQFQGVISRKFVPYKEQAKAYKDGLKYVRDYINSPGFAYRSSQNLNGQFGYFLLYNKYNFIPPVDSKITWIPGHRNANSNLKFGLFNTDRFPFRIDATSAHEGFHWNRFFNTKRRNKPFNLSKDPESPYYNYDYSHIPDEVKNILKPNEQMLKERHKLGLGDLKHDAELNEAYSDLGALRYNLEKEGIFDSKKAGEIFTKEHLEKYRKTERGKRDRFIQLHTDDQIIEAINVIAENNNENQEYELPMARKGLTLIKRIKL